MCKKYKWLQKFFAVLAVSVFLMGISALTVYADPGDDGGVPVANDGGEVSNGGEISNGGNSESAPADENADSGDTPRAESGNESDNADNGNNAENNNTDENTGEQEEQSTPDPVSIPERINEIRNKYIDNNEDISNDDSEYTPNKNLENLPTVATEEVAAATAEPLPDVEVSDATLFSGLIMWVCVAVGISVVAGVMVSKRTHRRG